MKTNLEHTDNPHPQGGSLFSNENIFGFFIFALLLAIYAKTLCPAVYWWDSGELIANIAVLGIPHRPGFPVYVLLGKVISLFPWGSFAFRINLLSAFFASLSLGIFYKTFIVILHLFFPDKVRRGKLYFFSALFFILTLGFTYSFWIQAVRAEVYSLNLLFFSLLLLSAILYLRDKKLKYVYLFFFLFGLGLGNHHLSLLSSLPALLFLIFFALPGDATVHRPSVVRHSSCVMHLKRLPIYFLFFLFGLSIYLYLPVRSLSHPLLAWGETKSIYSSARTVFAFDTLKHLNFDFLSNILTKFSQIFSILPDQLTLLCFTFSLAGLFLLFRHKRKLLAFLVLLLAGNMAVVIFMTTEFISTNPDLHGYLIFSVFSFAFSGGLAFYLILDSIRHSSFVIRHVVLLFLGLLSLFPLFKHYPEANLSKNRIAHDYGWSVISNLDSKSVLFVDNVNLNFILRELHYAEKMRADVTIVDRGLLGFDWYVKQKRSEQKDLFAHVPDNRTGEPVFAMLLKKCLDLNRPTYMEFTEKDSSLVNQLIPAGYVFKVSPIKIDRLSKDDLMLQKEWDSNGPFNIQNEVFQRDWDAQRVFALSFYRLGLFYEWRGMISLALDEFSRVSKVDSGDEDLILKTKRLETMQIISDSLSQEIISPSG